MGKSKSRLPAKAGRCCSCGHDSSKYKNAEDQHCLSRDDETHCEHWWDGTEDDPDKIPLPPPTKET